VKRTTKQEVSEQVHCNIAKIEKDWISNTEKKPKLGSAVRGATSDPRRECKTGDDSLGLRGGVEIEGGQEKNRDEALGDGGKITLAGESLFSRTSECFGPSESREGALKRIGGHTTGRRSKTVTI